MRRSSGTLEFEFFVAETTATLVRTAYLVTWDLATAEDLTQETLSRVARQWPRVAAMEFPTAYARTILLRLALRERSRHARTVSLDSVADVADDTSDLSRIDERADLRHALASLTARHRAVLALRYFSDLSEQEVADALGWPLGTVKSTTARALGALRARALDTVTTDTPTYLKDHTHDQL